MYFYCTNFISLRPYQKLLDWITTAQSDICFYVHFLWDVLPFIHPSSFSWLWSTIFLILWILCQGKLAIAFGDLLRKLWVPGAAPVAPRMFKSTISSFAPQFSGYNQHDSQVCSLQSSCVNKNWRLDNFHVFTSYIVGISFFFIGWPPRRSQPREKKTLYTGKRRRWSPRWRSCRGILGKPFNTQWFGHSRFVSSILLSLCIYIVLDKIMFQLLFWLSRVCNLWSGQPIIVHSLLLQMLICLSHKCLPLIVGSISIIIGLPSLQKVVRYIWSIYVPVITTSFFNAA